MPQMSPMSWLPIVLMLVFSFYLILSNMKETKLDMKYTQKINTKENKMKW